MNDMNYDTIVLSGGGVKGILVLGVLQYMTDSNRLRNIRNVVGTSIGAIIGYLLLVGYSPLEIITRFCTFSRLRDLQDVNIRSMMNGDGAVSMDPICELIEQMTLDKLKYIPTFGDLFDETNKRLIMCVYNISESKPEYMSHESHPNTQCIEAIRMTCNVPFVFEPYKFDGSYYIDGGMADNFPIQIGETIGKRVVGLYITQDTKPNRTDDVVKPSISNLLRLMSIPLTTIFESKRTHIRKNTRILSIQYENVHFLQFNISTATKLDMFVDGYRDAERQLRNDANTYSKEQKDA
jgi:predicted acylesterase/phospholipase RssA